VFRGGLDGELLVEGKVRVACLDAVNLKPTALPKELMRE
jgi:acyl-CoA thioesterase FadM